MGATTVTIASRASAMPRLAGGYIEISRLCVIGYIGPATAPWMARKTMSMVMLCAIPHRNEASENNSVAMTNSFVSPKRRVRKPVSGSAMALLTANEVMTHVLWLELTP